MSIRDRKAELAALVDEVAPDGWRDDRRWWGVLTATAIFERWARDRPSWVSVDGEPHADTFLGSPGPGPTDLAGWIGWAIAAAHAVITALSDRDGQFPGQPLRVRVARQRGRCKVVPATAASTVAFTLGHRVLVASLDPRGPVHELNLVRRLAEHARGTPGTGASAGPPTTVALATVDLDSPTPYAPLAVIAIGDEPLELAHHGHRRAWTGDGGPWLGVARACGLTVLSTCHLAVDGFGHAHLAADLVAGLDRSAARILAATAAAIVGDAEPPLLARIAATAAVPLGVAWRRLPAPTPTFAHQAWALGRVLAVRPGGSVRARGATLQIPVAAGPPDDPTRFARRVRTALVTVRCPDGRPEPYPGFAARACDAIADEAVGRGLLGRLLAGLAGAPVPRWLTRRWLGGARGPTGGGPGEILAGNGALSLLRLAGMPPLVAAAAPGQLLALDDEDATAVLTVIDDGHGATATVAGRGRAGTTAGATALLDDWVRALDEDLVAAADAPAAG